MPVIVQQTENILLSDAASANDAARCDGDSISSPTNSTSVLLVTELIRLTLKKLQAALEDNRINDDDLVAMAMAVDAGAVSAALQTTRGTAAICMKTSPSLPVNLQTSEITCSTTVSGSSFRFESQRSLPRATDRPAVMMTCDQNQPDMVSSSEIAAAAKKVLSDVISNLTEQ